jgi:hypothetical protein
MVAPTLGVAIHAVEIGRAIAAEVGLGIRGLLGVCGQLPLQELSASLVARLLDLALLLAELAFRLVHGRVLDPIPNSYQGYDAPLPSDNFQDTPATPKVLTDRFEWRRVAGRWGHARDSEPCRNVVKAT